MKRFAAKLNALLLLLGSGVAGAQEPAVKPPPLSHHRPGTLTYEVGFGQNKYGVPISFTEVSPGEFAGIMDTPGDFCIAVISTHKSSCIYDFPYSSYPFAAPLQGADGRIYGIAGDGNNVALTWALTLSGSYSAYPPGPTAPTPSIAMPTGPSMAQAGRMPGAPISSRASRRMALLPLCIPSRPTKGCLTTFLSEPRTAISTGFPK